MWLGLRSVTGFNFAIQTWTWKCFNQNQMAELSFYLAAVTGGGVGGWLSSKGTFQHILKFKVIFFFFSCTVQLLRCQFPNERLNLGHRQQKRQFLITGPQSAAQFSSVAQSCLNLCDPMNHSMPGLLVHHKLPKFTQTYVHRVSDAIQPSHPLSSSSPPAPTPSQHQSLFQ